MQQILKPSDTVPLNPQTFSRAVLLCKIDAIHWEIFSDKQSTLSLLIFLGGGVFSHFFCPTAVTSQCISILLV